MRTPEDNGPGKRQHDGAEISQATSYTPAIPEGCSAEAWRAIGAIAEHGVWKVPERNASGEVIGWNRRLASGEKKQEKGGKRGLTMAWPLDPYAGTSPENPIVIVEGASDCAAGSTIGLVTIGRPGASSGKDLLSELLKGRHVLIVGENDKSDAGRNGAENIGSALANVAVSVRIIFPPTGVKDLREWVLAGVDRETILNAARYSELVQSNSGSLSEENAIGPVLRNAADIPPAETRWLWPGRIPCGMISIIAGDPGLGKSTLTAAIASIVSTGGNWHGGGVCEPGGVLWLSAEDDPARVIVPRLMAHGANLSRVELLEGVRRVPGQAVAHPSLADDLPMLAQAIDRVPDCRLVVVDPISAYLGRTDANANAEVRALLTPLKALAEQKGSAFVLVQHLNKTQSANALHRMTGSIGFIGAARTGYIVVRDPDDEQRRLFLCVKNNIGPESAGLGFRIAGEPPRIVFDDSPVVLSANDALAASNPGAGEDRSALADAMEWLRERLAGIAGAPARTVLDDAKSAGIKQRTLERAKRTLRVKTVRAQGAWLWSLPDSGEGRQDRQPGEAGELGDVGDVRPDLPPGS